MVSLGIFSVATEGTMCPGVDSASKNAYHDTPGSKDGRCVRLTTYHLHSAESREDPGALTYRIPKGLLRPVAGQLFTQSSELEQCVYLIAKTCWYTGVYEKTGLPQCIGAIRVKSSVTDNAVK